MRSLTILLAVLGIAFASSTTNAQPCTWTVCSTIDCQLPIEFYLDCPPLPPVLIGSGATPYGCWGNEQCAPIVLDPCPWGTGCAVIVKINGVTVQSGDEICCIPGTTANDCISCNCAYVDIDYASGTVRLLEASGC